MAESPPPRNSPGSPDERDVVPLEQRVGRDDRGAVLQRRRDDEPIRGIAVVPGQSAGRDETVALSTDEIEALTRAEP